MGLFDLFKKDSKKRVLPEQEIVRMAQIHEPQSIYYPDGQHLVPEVERAVNAIMPLYDGISNLSTMLMLNDPSEMQKNIKNADVDTLLIFFKFLAIKASETNNNQPIGVVQNFLISTLQEKLS